MKVNVTPAVPVLPVLGGSGAGGAAHRGPRLCPRRSAEPGWSEGSREGEPSAHGNSQLGAGVPPEPLCGLAGGEGTPGRGCRVSGELSRGSLRVPERDGAREDGAVAHREEPGCDQIHQHPAWGWESPRDGQTDRAER